MDNNVICKNTLNTLLTIMKHYTHFLILAIELNKAKARHARYHCHGTAASWLIRSEWKVQC